MNKLVTYLSNKEEDDNEQETSEMKFEEFALKTNVLAFAIRSKAKARHEDVLLPAHLQELYQNVKRSWTDMEPETYSPNAYPVSKRLSTLLRHGHLPREEDGAFEFWRLKDYLRNDLEYSQHWSDEMWKSRMAGSGGTRIDFNMVMIHQGEKFFISELFKVIQDAHPIDPSLRDNVLIPNRFFEYIYHIGCAINYIPSQIPN